MKLCSGCNQETESTLKCPTCLRLSLPSAYFCSQDCFKANWKSHTKVHQESVIQSADVDDLSFGQNTIKRGFNPENRATWSGDFHLRLFLNFDFTGLLRPWPRSLPVTCPSHIEQPDYARSGTSVEEERDRKRPIKIYDEEAVSIMRRVCALGRRALDLAHSRCQVGTTTEAIDDAVRTFCFENNAYPSPLNYYHFPKSCCTSVNEVICHGIPDLRPLREGDIVNVDISIYSEGYHCDLNETFLVGDPQLHDPQTVKLVKASHDCLHAAIKICKPGVPYSQIGNVIQKFIDDLGFSVVRRYTGHGVGQLFHTNPYVPHYKNNKAKGIMQPGHVFTIEPMINQGTHHDVLWPDEWTAVTRDGLKSAQFEHQILITETGCEVLTARTKESPPLEFDCTLSAS